MADENEPKGMQEQDGAPLLCRSAVEPRSSPLPRTFSPSRSGSCGCSSGARRSTRWATARPCPSTSPSTCCGRSASCSASILSVRRSRSGCCPSTSKTSSGARLAEIERKVELTGTLWREVVDTMPPIPNTALHDTLAQIGDFPKHYDFRSMAHEIPVQHRLPALPSGAGNASRRGLHQRVPEAPADRGRLPAALRARRVRARARAQQPGLRRSARQPVRADRDERHRASGDRGGPGGSCVISDEARAEIATAAGPVGRSRAGQGDARGGARRCATRSASETTTPGSTCARSCPSCCRASRSGLARGDLRGVFVG